MISNKKKYQNTKGPLGFATLKNQQLRSSTSCFGILEKPRFFQLFGFLVGILAIWALFKSSSRDVCPTKMKRDITKNIKHESTCMLTQPKEHEIKDWTLFFLLLNMNPQKFKGWPLAEWAWFLYVLIVFPLDCCSMASNCWSHPDHQDSWTFRGSEAFSYQSPYIGRDIMAHDWIWEPFRHLTPNPEDSKRYRKVKVGTPMNTIKKYSCVFFSKMMLFDTLFPLTMRVYLGPIHLRKNCWYWLV